MSSVVGYDVCDTSLIYQEGVYEYSLPRKVLEGFLSGKAFDHPEAYTDDEFGRLCEDIREIFETLVSSGPERAPLAVMTAGAPGAGKTIKMQQELAEKASLGQNFAYICPDDVCLRRQRRTYEADVASGDGSKEGLQAAYNKWRPGSNAGTHLILANLIREMFAFYFGTTSSSPQAQIFFNFFKKNGYHIRLIHLSAPDDVRWGSIQERDKTFVQTTEVDVVEKGRLVTERIMDTFLAYADEIDFHHRDSVSGDAELTAK